jgi:hypothetical protein
MGKDSEVQKTDCFHLNVFFTEINIFMRNDLKKKQKKRQVIRIITKKFGLV